MLDGTQEPYASARRTGLPDATPGDTGSTTGSAARCACLRPGHEPSGTAWILIVIGWFGSIAGPLLGMRWLTPLYEPLVRRTYLSSCESLLNQAGQPDAFVTNLCAGDATLYLMQLSISLHAVAMSGLLVLLLSFQNWRRDVAGECRWHRQDIRRLRLLIVWVFMIPALCGLAYVFGDFLTLARQYG